MKHYELMYIIPVKVGKEDGVEIQDKVRAALQAEGAKITLEEALGKRKLAYPVNHIRHGSYVLMEIDLEPDKLARVNDWFRLSPDVLRTQIITKQVKSPEQMAREKALQEKLMRKQAKLAEDELKGTAAQVSPAAKPAPETKKVELAELDKKLEEILQQEIVK